MKHSPSQGNWGELENEKIDDFFLLHIAEHTMAFLVTRDTLLDTTLAVSDVNRSIPFEVWLHAVSFLVVTMRTDYIVINQQVIYITENFRVMTPIHIFKRGICSHIFIAKPLEVWLKTPGLPLTFSKVERPYKMFSRCRHIIFLSSLYMLSILVFFILYDALFFWVNQTFLNQTIKRFNTRQ